MGSFQQITSQGTSVSTSSSPDGRSVSTGAGAWLTPQSSQSGIAQVEGRDPLRGNQSQGQAAGTRASRHRIRTILSSRSFARETGRPLEMIENSAHVPVSWRYTQPERADRSVRVPVLARTGTPASR